MLRHVAVDGNNLFHRFYYVTKDEGEHPVYKIANWLFGELENPNAKSITFAWDSSKNFKKEQYPFYKAGRKEKEPDFYPKLREARDFLVSCGVRQIEVEGYEADDILFTLAHEYGDVEIVSSDRDMLLCVHPEYGAAVRLIKRGDDGSYEKLIATEEQAQEETGGIPTNLYLHYKALVGDSSDNIKGVPLVGSVKAKGLIVGNDKMTGWDSLYNISAAIELIKYDFFGKKWVRNLEKSLAIDDEPSPTNVWDCLKLVQPVQLNLGPVDFSMPEKKRILNAVQKFNIGRK